MTYGTGGAFGSAPSVGGGYAKMGGGYMPGGQCAPVMKADGCMKIGCGGGGGAEAGASAGLVVSVAMLRVDEVDEIC